MKCCDYDDVGRFQFQRRQRGRGNEEDDEERVKLKKWVKFVLLFVKGMEIFGGKNKNDDDDDEEEEEVEKKNWVFRVLG